MFRFFFRVLASLSLAGAVVMAVLDATRSVAASELVVTPLAQSLETAFPNTLEAMRTSLEGFGSYAWDPIALAVLQLPGWVVLSVLAFLLYAVGHRRSDAERRWA